MGFNPFIDDFPVESADEWVGDQTLIEILRNSAGTRTNTYIVGPEGSGKTSLLRTAFTPEYRRKMAETRKKLIYFADLSNKSDGNDICEYLADRLKLSLNQLIRDRELLSEIHELTGEISAMPGQARFQNFMQVLHDNWGYMAVIIMDYFELFTMSNSVTQAHHDCLRSLIESGQIQCVVATNYDLSKDSLPRDIRGSYFLQKFTNPIEMTCFAEDDIGVYLYRKQEGGGIMIPDAMKTQIFRLSGGIPRFVNILARQLYASGAAHNGRILVKEAVREARAQCEIVMDGWCKLLTDAQLDVMRLLASNASSNAEYACYDFAGSAYETAVSALLHRGLFRKAVCQDQNGNPVCRDFLVRFNSLLFQYYCQEGRMADAANQNPLPEIERKRSADTGRGGNTYIIDKYYQEGAVDESQNVSVENMQIVQGISVKDFLQLLGGSSREESGLLIGRRLQRQISQFDREKIRIEMNRPVTDAAEHDRRVDQAFAEAGQQIFQDVQVDEYQDIIEITETELQTLDERFLLARNRIHQDLKDDLLDKQSERCQFYIKMAVVVEEALSMPGIEFDDFSAQLILYGKAAEQALRDNLFGLFQGIPDLAEYSLGKRLNIPDARDNFRHMDVSRTFLGNFVHLIRAKKTFLAELCADTAFRAYCGVIPGNWSAWWGKMAADINRIREIRNLAGHADQHSPERENLRQMYTLLVGDGTTVGILNQILAGRDLALRYLAPAISQSDAETLIGQCLEMKCTKIKSNGGIRGKLTDSGYEVNISPRKVSRYRQDTGAAGTIRENSLLRVRILEFKHDSDKDFFAAEIEGMA